MGRDVTRRWRWVVWRVLIALGLGAAINLLVALVMGMLPWSLGANQGFAARTRLGKMSIQLWYGPGRLVVRHNLYSGLEGPPLTPEEYDALRSLAMLPHLDRIRAFPGDPETDASLARAIADAAHDTPARRITADTPSSSASFVGWPMYSLSGWTIFNAAGGVAAGREFWHIRTPLGPGFEVMPLTPMPIGTLVNSTLFSLPWLLLLFGVPAWRRARRRSRGWCERCGYDLLHDTSRLCPECGSRARTARESAPSGAA